MCGIAGLVNAESNLFANNNYCKFVEQAAITGVLRGVDSTGMFQVDKKGDAVVYKLPVAGGVFAETRVAKALFNNVDVSPLTVLHHRAATRGRVNYDTSHPFEHVIGNRYLVGVHNGSLTNTPDTYDGIDFSVDSDYALYRILKDGKAAFSEFAGAYAFVWYEDDHKLRIACNGERSFSFAYVHKKNTMLMASEPSMLYWLAERNNLEIEAPVQPDKFKLLTFDLDGDLRDFTDEAIDKPKIKAITYNNGGSSKQENFSQTPTGSAKSADHAEVVSITCATRDLLKHGDEVEFFPDKSTSTATQLQGDVLVDNIESGCTLIPSLLTPVPRALYSNLLSDQVVSVVAKVRGWSTTVDKDGKSTGSILLLGDAITSTNKTKVGEMA